MQESCPEVMVQPGLVVMGCCRVLGTAICKVALDAAEGPVLEIVAVTVNGCPLSIWVGACKVTARSACAVTFVVAVTWLLTVLGSAVEEVTSADAVMGPPAAGAVAAREIWLLAPAARLASVQTTVLLLIEHPDVVVETLLSPLGRVTVVVALDAVDGPLLVIVK